MAGKGLKNIYYAVIQSDTATATVYGDMVKLGHAVSVDVNPDVGTATIFGDDRVVETEYHLKQVNVTIETTDIPLSDLAVLLGHTYEEGGLTWNSADRAPYVGLAYERDLTGGKTRYVKLYKGKFEPTQETINTRKENLEYQTPKLTGVFIARESDGDIRYSEEHPTGTNMADWYTSF